jgi:hypothetical protein
MRVITPLTDPTIAMQDLFLQYGYVHYVDISLSLMDKKINTAFVE